MMPQMKHDDKSMNAVHERRLRPIYDNLEVGNNRKALQETEKLLKKYPTLLCARALKGLALLRLGRYEESNGILKTVADEKPTDDSTLQILSFCFKEFEQLDKIVGLYSYAVQKNPGNEELLAHLFISHVRMDDFKAQHSVALQLYKAQPKNAYYFWAVMSVLLQVTRGAEKNNPDKSKILLTLAERMIDKMIKENKLESEQEVMLYYRILKLQKRYEDALNFLNSPLCEKAYPGAPVELKIDTLKDLEKWQDVKSLLKELLAKDHDRWDYYQEYLNSCFKLLKSPTTPNDHETATNDAGDAKAHSESEKTNGVLSALDECHDFLCQLIESREKKVRGPYLARLDLHQRMRLNDLDARALLGNFSELVIEYFRLFGDKSCCTHDIALFVPAISMEDRQELAGKLLLESGISSTTLPQTKEQMQKHICALQISRICGVHVDLKTEHLQAFYTALKLHYEHGLSNFGKNLLHTDMGPSDPYALLAANVMYDISIREQNSQHLFEALCLLQYVLRNSTSNFHVKLLSLKIYHMLGCLLGAQEMYDYLDIKNIQLDSMGYVHCNLLPLSGRFSTGRSICDFTLKFFTNSYKERLEYIALAYRFCTFNKLEEFMKLKERLSNSLHYTSMSVEAQLTDLVTLYGNFNENLETYTAMSIEPADDRISWYSLCDNRDLAAMVRWDPVHLVDVEAERKESFQQEVEVLQIRSLHLRLLAAFIDLYHDSMKTSKFKLGETDSSSSDSGGENSKIRRHNMLETIELLRDSWCGLFKRLRTTNYKPLSNRFLVSLLPTRIHLLLEVPYEKFFNDLAQLVLELHAGAPNLPLQCKVVSDNVSELKRICSQTIAESDQATEDGLWKRRYWQGKICACLEILAHYAFMLSVYYEKISTTVKTTTKPRKKNVANVAENETQGQLISDKERLQLLVELMRHLKKELQACEALVVNWKSPALPRDLNSFMADMSLKPEVEATLIGDVSSIFKESHELMVTELRNLIKDKIRMVNK